MRMGFRWYGKGNDSVKLTDIKQIPNTTEIVWALHNKVAGEVWEEAEVFQAMKEITSEGFNGTVVESVNVHEDIKLGKPSRDTYIENYKISLRNLAKVGVKVVCYNFMPVFDWARTDLFKLMEDGSTALFFEKAKIDNVDPFLLVQEFLNGSGEYTMPGWEPDRLSHLEELFKAYKNVSEDQLRANLGYFLKAILPTCEEVGIKMAIHPDDPPYSIFGLPRIVKCHEDLQAILNLNSSPSNGITFCTGALGASLTNNIPEMLESFFDRVYFMHIRNVKVWENGNFIETAHRSCEGSVNITAVMEILERRGFNYVARPDHGRHIWDEQCRPGYGLYDRALGITYLWGLYDAFKFNVNKEKK